MRLLSESIVKGNPFGESVEMQMYAMYIMNGGNPEDFRTFTDYDIQAMYTVYESLERRRLKNLTENIAKLMGLERK